MAKSRPFSIYLLKVGFGPANSLRPDHDLEAADAANLPEGSSLFILDSDRSRPWWRAYFGVEADLWQQQKGALVFLPVGDRCFALSFGQALNHLDERSYEYDFGLRVTLNSLDPRHLKSADMVSPGAARRKRTQVPSSTELTYLDFDGNSEIIKSLTGAVKTEHATLFKNATGSTSLKVSLKLDAGELAGVCATLLQLYDSDEYLTTFPNIQNISPVNDPGKIAELDAELQEAIRNRDPNLLLGIPDIVDYRDNTCCVFDIGGQRSEVTPDISLQSFYSFADVAGIDAVNLTIDNLKGSRIILTDYEGSPSQSFQFYRSLIFDARTEIDGHTYHLCEGKWYRVQTDYLNRLTAYIDAKCEESDLPGYNHDEIKDGKRIYSEGGYNDAVPIFDGSFICLDRTDISPHGSTAIEPCDLYKVIVDPSADGGHRAVMYGIKISTRSAQLSHLFNQGLNAVELVRQESVCRENLKAIVADRIGGNDLPTYLSAIDRSAFKVIFGIITDKSKEDKSANLPLFSKISLMRAMQRLDLMMIPTALTFILDESPPKEGYARYPSVVVRVFEENGRNVVRPIAGQDIDPTKMVARCPKAVRDSAPGSQYRMMVKTDANGNLSTYHGWPYEAVH